MNKIAFGTMGIPHDVMEEVLKEVVKYRYELIDTAWVYKNEHIVGPIVKKLRDQGKEITLQTKIWTDHFDNVIEQFESQQKTLGTRVNILLLHRPSLCFKKSIQAWKDLIQLHKQGKVDHIGVSNFDRDMIEILIKETGVKPYCNQIELSVDNYREDRVAYCKSRGIHIQAYTPLGITGLHNPVIHRLAEQRHCTSSQICVAYAAHDGATVVVRTSQPSHVKENMGAKNITLNSTELETLHNENKYTPKYEETYPY